MEIPQTRYARSGDVNIAYQVVGDGDVDLVWIPGFAHHLELNWTETYRRRWLEALASRYRVITFDKRGTGLSDRPTGTPPLETRMDDIRAVLDAAGVERAVIFAAGDAGALAVMFAAAFPRRTRALILHHFVARETWAPDYPWGPRREELMRDYDEYERRWPDSLYEAVAELGPSLTADEQRAFAEVIRYSVSPGAAAGFWRTQADVDLRDVLPTLRVPTLVVAPGDESRRGASRAAAEMIPHARFLALDGPDLFPVVGDTRPLLEAAFEFVDDVGDEPPEAESVLATVLFTDIVDSTARAAELGDRGWRELLVRHHAITRRELSRFRGVEHDTAGDGFFASFDGPARAIRCACSIRDALNEIDVEVRAGLHTGECQVHEDKVTGIAVSIGARVAASAASGEVLVSQTVKDLVAGSGLAFEDRGAAELKGVPGEWRLYAVADAAA